MKKLWTNIALGLGLILAIQGCTRSEPQPGIPYAEFVRSISDSADISRLDVPETRLLSSYDPSGGNNDFNNFVAEGPKGWAILADLKGPGYVSRFWTTGGKSRKQRLRFYFDGEKEPRIDATIEELRDHYTPFLPPLSRYEQSCWYCYVPLTYRTSLKIMAEVENYGRKDGPRLFYQVNATALPEDQAVESFPRIFGETDLDALRRMGSSWLDPLALAETEKLSEAIGETGVEPGQTGQVEGPAGPAVIRRFDLAIEIDGEESLDLELFLQQVTLRAYWDGQSTPSVESPLGAFFGRMWRSPSAQSAYFGSSNLAFNCRFPMPYREGARFTLENTSPVPFKARFKLLVEPLEAWDEGLGYFHAAWNRSPASSVGKPHNVLKTAGKGRFAGCLLGALNEDKSWWLLEADETMRIDGEAEPRWKGTGLEDYFNGAWYYKNNLARAMHGLIFKAPFRTVQYRIHPTDAVQFNTLIDVQFERGPDQASHGLLESVGFYYLAKPSATVAIGKDANRAPPRDALEKGTVMTDLCNYERFADYQGAIRYVDYYLETYPDETFLPMLRLRKIAYRETLLGFNEVGGEYMAFMEMENDPNAIRFARMLTWFHEDPSHTLLSLFSSNPARVFVNGSKAAEVNHPTMFYVVPVKIGSGRHVLAIETARKQYPEWVQACLRTHKGLVVTDRTWKFAFSPQPGWQRVEYSDIDWAVTGDSYVEGPPIPPHIWTTPHPFVNMQSKPLGIWAGAHFPKNTLDVGFRKNFIID